MKKLIALALLIASPLFAQDLLIIHEKEANGQWVMALTVAQDAAAVAEAVSNIDSDPTLQRGPNFGVYGGFRLQIVETVTPGEVTWEAQPSNKWLVFWNVTGSTDPADFFIAEFLSQAEAEEYINQVKLDPGLSLWDDRPFQVDTRYVAQSAPDTTVYSLALP